jgi:hypothetical protein
MRLPSRLLRRLLGPAVATALLMAGPTALVGQANAAASPCQNADAPTMVDVGLTIWQPPAGASDATARQCTPDANTTLTGTWTVDVDASSLDTLSGFAVAIVPMKGNIPPLPSGATVARQYPPVLTGQGKLSDTIDFAWNTASLTPYNGVYEISATATSLLGDTVNGTVTGLTVNNPPATPAGVTAALAGTTPVVSWSANPEPDLLGYQVLRSAGGAYSVVATQTGTTFDDPAAPQGGPLTYEVVAIRSSPASSNGIASSPSSPSNPVTPGALPIAPSALAPPSPKPLPKLPAPKLAAPAADNGTVGTVNNTFAPTLPFAQAVPTETLVAPTPVGPQALAGEQGTQGSTTAQKIRFLAAAAFLLVVAGLVFKIARRLQRSE